MDLRRWGTRWYLAAWVGLCGVHLWSAGFARASSPQPSDASIQDYHSGNGLLSRGLYDLAAKEYEKFLAEHSDHAKAPVARYGLALCLFRQQQLEAALTQLAAIVNLPSFEYAAEALALSGQCAMGLSQYERAGKAFQTFVQRFPEHDLADDAAALGIESWQRAGQPQHADELYRNFKKRFASSPFRARAELFAGLAAVGNSDDVAATRHFQFIVEHAGESEYAPQATMLLAQCMHRTGKLTSAGRYYQAILEAQTSPFRAEAFYGLGLVKKQQGDPEQAARLLTQFIELDPQAPQVPAAKLYIGQCRLDAGDTRRAIEMLKMVADDSPIGQEATYWLAKAYARAGEHALSARTISEAIASNADRAFAAEMTYDLAVAQLQQQEPEQAATTLEQFLQRYSDSELAPQATYLLALAAHRAGDYTGSGRHCEAYLATYPQGESSAAVLFLSAENNYLKEEYKEAAMRYEKFIRRFSKDAQITDARYRLGLCYYRLAQLDDALKALNRVESDDQAFADRYFFVGDILFQQSQWSGARTNLSRYIERDPRGPYADAAWLKIGLTCVRDAQYKQAIAHFDEVIKSFDDSPHRLQALFERGQAQVALGQLEQADASFERVLKEGPDSRFAAHATRLRGQLQYQKGDYQAAAEQFEHLSGASDESALQAEGLFFNAQALLAAEKFEAAEKAFQRFIQKYPDHERATQARTHLVVVLARQGEAQKTLQAVKAFEKYARQSDAKVLATVLYEKAWALRQLDKPGDAKKAYLELIKASGDADLTAHAVLELAEMEAADQRWAEATALLDQLHKFIAGDEARYVTLLQTANYRQGVYLYQAKDYTRAAEMFATFIDNTKDQSSLASSLFLCAEALYQSGDYAGAIPHLKRLVEEFPDYDQLPNALLRLGETLASVQRWKQSEAAFRQFLERYGDSELWFQARFGVGWAQENRGRLDEAIAAYRSVTSRHQGATAARAQFQIGECLFAKKQFEDAASELIKVEILYGYPEWSAAAIYEAGRCFEQLGESIKARQQFEKVTAEYRDTRWARLASEKLENDGRS